MLNKSKAWAVALLAATFVAGVAVGGAVSTAWGGGRGPSGEFSERRPGYAERLTAELGLTQAQRESVAAVVEQRRDEMHELWQEIAPRFDTLRSQLRAEIMALLDEQQRQRFEALVAQNDSLRALRKRGAKHEK